MKPCPSLTPDEVDTTGLHWHNARRWLVDRSVGGDGGRVSTWNVVIVCSSRVDSFYTISLDLRFLVRRLTYWEVLGGNDTSRSRASGSYMPCSHDVRRGALVLSRVNYVKPGKPHSTGRHWCELWTCLSANDDPPSPCQHTIRYDTVD